MRQPGPCAVCECVALSPSKNMTCVRPRSNGTPSEDFLLRQPSPCVRAVCARVALLPSNNMTCVRPPCTARPREDFLHTSHASRVTFAPQHVTSSELFLRKSTRFRGPAFSQNEAHATSMHPLQCVSQPHVANPHLSTYMATQHGNIHTAIPMRSATLNSTTA